MISEIFNRCKSGSNMTPLLCKTPCICVAFLPCYAFQNSSSRLCLPSFFPLFSFDFIFSCTASPWCKTELCFFVCSSSYAANRFDLFSQTCYCIRNSLGVDFDFIMNENNHFNADISQFLPYTSVVPIRKINDRDKMWTETICVM